MSRYHYLATIYNYDSISGVGALFLDKEARYAVFQEEQCPSTGRKHLQGYIEFKKKIALKTLRSILPGTHYESRKGTREEARDYCMKEESRISPPQEFGTWASGQGSRTDLVSLKERLDAGAGDMELYDDFFGLMLRYGSQIRTYRLLKNRPPPSISVPMIVEIYWGETGTGKSRKAFEENPGAFWLHRHPTGVWFDGYQGEECIVIDEFYGWISWDFMLRLLDRYPLQLPVKGGSVWRNCKKIVITSNQKPEEWYDCDKLRVDFATLSRRFTSVTKMNLLHPAK